MRSAMTACFVNCHVPRKPGKALCRLEVRSERAGSFASYRFAPPATGAGDADSRASCNSRCQASPAPPAAGVVIDSRAGPVTPGAVASPAPPARGCDVDSRAVPNSRCPRPRLGDGLSWELGTCFTNCRFQAPCEAFCRPQDTRKCQNPFWLTSWLQKSAFPTGSTVL